MSRMRIRRQNYISRPRERSFSLFSLIPNRVPFTAAARGSARRGSKLVIANWIIASLIRIAVRDRFVRKTRIRPRNGTLSAFQSVFRRDTARINTSFACVFTKFAFLIAFSFIVTDLFLYLLTCVTRC